MGLLRERSVSLALHLSRCEYMKVRKVLNVCEKLKLYVSCHVHAANDSICFGSILTQHKTKNLRRRH